MLIIKKSTKVYLVTMVLSILLLAVCSILIFNEKINSSKASLDTITLFIGMLIFFLLGFLSANCYQKKGLVISIFHCLLPLTIFVLISLLGFEDLAFRHFYKYFILFLCSSIGGIIGVNFKQIIK